MVTSPAETSFVAWQQIPELRDPVLVAGFSGWPDAGSVSSDTLVHLGRFLQPTVFAVLDNEPFTQHASDRPIAQIEDGIIHELEPLVTELSFRHNPDGSHDAVFLLGKEPHLNWSTYASTILGVMKQLGIRRLYTIGGVQDSISHASPPQVTVVGSSPTVINEVMKLGKDIRAAEYYGPVSIHSYLIAVCAKEGIDAVSLWGHAPAYLQKNPSIVHRIVTILNRAIDMDCPVELLRQKSIELDRKVNEALSKDPDLRDFVETLERKDGAGEPSSGHDKVIKLSEFLRRDSQRDPDE